MKLNLKWKFIKLYAVNTTAKCTPLADAPMRKECFSSIEMDVPIDITINLPIQDKKVMDCRKTNSKKPCGGPVLYND